MRFLSTFALVALFTTQALAADCPAMFDEIEPGFCDRQAEREARELIQYRPNFGYFDQNGPYDNFEFRPMYETSSVSITAGEAALIAGVAASAILVFNNDQELMDFVQDNKNEITEEVAFWGEKMGSMPSLLGAGGYVLGMVMDNDEVKKTSMLIVKTTLISGLVTRAMKMSFSRKRPNVGDGPYEFAGFDASNDHVSFPSGHTTSAFAFATVIAETYKDKSSLIPVLAYGAAAVGAWSRVHDNAHWASDVLVGALVGHLTTKLMMRESSANTKYDMSFYPVFTSEYSGIHFQFKGKVKKDKSASRFFDKCHAYHDANPSFEDPTRSCVTMYFNSVWKK